MTVTYNIILTLILSFKIENKIKIKLKFVKSIIFNSNKYHVRIDYSDNIGLRSTMRSRRNINMLTIRNKNIMKFNSVRNKDLDTWTLRKDRFSDII